MFLAWFISSLQKLARRKERFRNSSEPGSTSFSALLALSR